MSIQELKLKIIEKHYMNQTSYEARLLLASGDIGRVAVLSEMNGSSSAFIEILKLIDQTELELE